MRFSNGRLWRIKPDGALRSKEKWSVHRYGAFVVVLNRANRRVFGNEWESMIICRMNRDFIALFKQKKHKTEKKTRNNVQNMTVRAVLDRLDRKISLYSVRPFGSAPTKT